MVIPPGGSDPTRKKDQVGPPKGTGGDTGGSTTNTQDLVGPGRPQIPPGAMVDGVRPRSVSGQTFRGGEQPPVQHVGRPGAHQQATHIENGAVGAWGPHAAVAAQVHPQRNHGTDQELLRTLSDNAMRERGLEPEFPQSVLDEMKRVKANNPINSPQIVNDKSIRNLTNLLWSSVDNDDSKDLDQIEYAEDLGNGTVKILVGVADVDEYVPEGSEADKHARKNTTSIYTAGRIYPMLHTDYSTDMTSLNQAVDRLAIVTEMVINKETGEVVSSDMYRARVNNKAQLAYDGVGGWLANEGPMPEKVAKNADLQKQLQIQDVVAQALRKKRHESGALEFETIKPEAVLRDGKVVDLKDPDKNRARQLIEEFMVAANGVAARELEAAGFPTIRRVVKSPEKWAGIVQLAQANGYNDLPKEPTAADAGLKLEQFLAQQKKANPLTFPDLSLSVVKLMGRGEFALEQPGDKPLGHFGLGVLYYAHSTAPNRLYGDLELQRDIKDMIAGRPPRPNDRKAQLAEWLTLQEGNATKIERQIGKSAAAMFLQDRVGQEFEAIVTGASDKGTYVRVAIPPENWDPSKLFPLDGAAILGVGGKEHRERPRWVEGQLAPGRSSQNVGQRLSVILDRVNIVKGFIDFNLPGQEPRGDRGNRDGGRRPDNGGNRDGGRRPDNGNINRDGDRQSGNNNRSDNRHDKGQHKNHGARKQRHRRQ